MDHPFSKIQDLPLLMHKKNAPLLYLMKPFITLFTLVFLPPVLGMLCGRVPVECRFELESRTTFRTGIGPDIAVSPHVRSQMRVGLESALTLWAGVRTADRRGCDRAHLPSTVSIGEEVVALRHSAKWEVQIRVSALVLVYYPHRLKKIMVHNLNVKITYLFLYYLFWCTVK